MILVYLEQQPEIPMSATVQLNGLLIQTPRKRVKTLKQTRVSDYVQGTQETVYRHLHGKIVYLPRSQPMKVWPGTHCLRMRKDIWKTVRKCICKQTQSHGHE